MTTPPCEPQWLDALARRFAEPSVSAVVGPVLEIGRTPPNLVIRFPTFDPSRDEASFDREQDDWFSRVRMGAIGSGTNLAVRREVFETAGPFRPGLGAGAPIAGDENYFLLSLVEGGHRVVNEPTARVHHPAQSPSRLREISEDRAAYFLYVFLTRPALRRHCAKLLISKFSRPREQGDTRRGSLESRRHTVDRARQGVRRPTDRPRAELERDLVLSADGRSLSC